MPICLALTPFRPRLRWSSINNEINSGALSLRFTKPANAFKRKINQCALSFLLSPTSFIDDSISRSHCQQCFHIVSNLSFRLRTSCTHFDAPIFADLIFAILPFLFASPPSTPTCSSSTSSTTTDKRFISLPRRVMVSFNARLRQGRPVTIPEHKRYRQARSSTFNKSTIASNPEFGSEMTSCIYGERSSSCKMVRNRDAVTRGER